MTNKLPEDITRKILLRLSVASLLRFRCICTAWCNLIKSHDFINMHLNSPTVKNNHQVLIKRCLQDRCTSVLSIHSDTDSFNIVLPELEIPYLDEEDLDVFGPCNGLVCISGDETIILCNPAIRVFTLVPERPFGCPADMRYFYKGIGFGFDDSTNDYKVIRFVHLEDDDDDDDLYINRNQILKAEVYQCSTDSWREIDTTLPELCHETCFELFFHGATHWYAKRDSIRMILSFCMSTEVFQEFNLPNDCDGKSKCLTVLNESLAMLCYTDPWGDPDEQFIDIWVMREYGISETWTKQFTIGPLSKIRLPLTSWKDCAILMERTNGQLISCGIDTQEIKEFNIFAYPRTLRAMVYKDSLVSIRNDNEVLTEDNVCDE